MMVSVIVFGWCFLFTARITVGDYHKVFFFFNRCYQSVLTYILTLLCSASVLWIGTMYTTDSLSMVSSVSYSGYLILLQLVIYLVSTIFCSTFELSVKKIGSLLALGALCYVNFLNIFNFYSVSVDWPHHP